MPVTAKDVHGRLHSFLVTGVRCVPSMRDSLLSVGQLWQLNNTDCRFADVRALILAPDPTGNRTRLPIIRRGGLYEWHVTCQSDVHKQPARVLAMHSARASSHIHV
eukprot:1429854-Pleurochrysis_carterae.AAC.1